MSEHVALHLNEAEGEAPRTYPQHLACAHIPHRGAVEERTRPEGAVVRIWLRESGTVWIDVRVDAVLLTWHPLEECPPHALRHAGVHQKEEERHLGGTRGLHTCRVALCRLKQLVGARVEHADVVRSGGHRLAGVGAQGKRTGAHVDVGAGVGTSPSFRRLDNGILVVWRINKSLGRFGEHKVNSLAVQPALHIDGIRHSVLAASCSHPL